MDLVCLFVVFHIRHAVFRAVDHSNQASRSVHVVRRELIIELERAGGGEVGRIVVRIGDRDLVADAVQLADHGHVVLLCYRGGVLHLVSVGGLVDLFLIGCGDVVNGDHGFHVFHRGIVVIDRPGHRLDAGHVGIVGPPAAVDGGRRRCNPANDAEPEALTALEIELIAVQVCDVKTETITLFS